MSNPTSDDVHTSLKKRTSLQLDPPKMTNALDAQLIENQDELAKDMLNGMTDLLNMHNSDEMRILCESLHVENFYESSKADNINYILNHVIGLEGSEERTEGEISAGYTKVLRTVWDGIVIEYLRSIGKNLMRCKDNLRGAVLNHWRRHAVVKVTMNAEGNPVFVQQLENAELYQLPPMPKSMDPSKCEEALEELKQLWEAEKLLKLAERRVRENTDFQSIVDFLAHVAKVRTMEDKIRGKLWSLMTESITHHHHVEQESEQSKSEKENAETELKHTIRQFELKYQELELKNCFNQTRIIETIKHQIRIAKLETDRKERDETIQRERERYKGIIAGKNDEIAVLERKLQNALDEGKHWKSTAQNTAKQLDDTQKTLWETQYKYDEQSKTLQHTNMEHKALLVQVVNQESVSETYFSIAATKAHALDLLQTEYGRICGDLLTAQEDLENQHIANQEEVGVMETEIVNLNRRLYELENRQTSRSLVSHQGENDSKCDSSGSDHESEIDDSTSVATETTKGGSKVKRKKKKVKRKTKGAKKSKSKTKPKGKKSGGKKMAKDNESVSSNKRPKSRQAREKKIVLAK